MHTYCKCVCVCFSAGGVGADIQSPVSSLHTDNVSVVPTPTSPLFSPLWLPKRKFQSYIINKLLSFSLTLSIDWLQFLAPHLRSIHPTLYQSVWFFLS